MTPGGLPILTYHAIDATRGVTATDPGLVRRDPRRAGRGGLSRGGPRRLGRAGPARVDRGFALAFDDGLRSILRVADVVRPPPGPGDRLPRHRPDRPRQRLAGPAGGRSPRARCSSWSDLDALAAAGLPVRRARPDARAGSTAATPPRSSASCAARATRSSSGSAVPAGCWPIPTACADARVRRAAARHFDAAFGTRLDCAPRPTGPASTSPGSTPITSARRGRSTA